jgi:hypothetical protein
MAFSEARSRVPEPEVSLVAPTRRVPDTTTAQAIGAAASLASSARQAKLLADQRKEFGRLGDEVSVLQDEGTFIERDEAGNVVNVDIDFVADPGEVDETSERLIGLAEATRQGKVSQARLQIETEMILRSAIARAPGFAPEFREQARRILGFDPSGSAVRRLLGFDESPVEKNPLIRTAEGIAATGVMPFQTALNLVGRAAVADQEHTVLRFQTAGGAITANQASIKYAKTAATRATGVLAEVLTEVKEQGAIVEPSRYLENLASIEREVLQEMREDMVKSGVVAPSDLSAAEAFVIGEFQPIEDFITNNDMLQIASRNADIVADLYSTMAAKLFPGLQLMSQFGDGAVNTYLEYLQIANGDEAKLKELMDVNPKLATFRVADLQADKIGEAMSRILRRLPTDDLPSLTVEMLKEMMTASDDPETQDAATNKKLEDGQTNEALSAIGSRTNSFDTANEDTRLAVKNSFPLNQINIQAEIASELTGTGFKVGFRDGLFDLVPLDSPDFFPEDLLEASAPQRAQVRRRAGRGGRSAGVIPRLRTDFGLIQGRFGKEIEAPDDRRGRRNQRSLVTSLKPSFDKLNQAQWSVVRKPNWPEFLGFTRDEYILQTIEQINSQVAADNALLEVSPNLSTQLDSINDLIEVGVSRVKDGRILANEDGTFSSLRNISVQDERLNSGAVTLIPTVNEEGKLMSDEASIESAVRSGRAFPLFGSEEEATAVSNFISERIRGSVVEEVAEETNNPNLVPAQPGELFVDPETGQILTVPSQ